ncbi:DVU_1553 family AMP-dependent CoA ligase [Pseudodesulfovibrio sediminis]|uniref:AMP-binding protein n=1 Tax=Pseudodesulfovibrio sediminis TaxID=2810563 RepID=A0ABM7P581_9BACT|nr:AMP-binding protein [Pseudodesulfovibrio sediminis]BCS88052.1 AMP-binding protein [Pseudodesulfovibrio sediminis]
MTTLKLDTCLMRRMGLPEGSTPPSFEAVRGWQARTLRDLVAHAQQRSPFYARHFDGVEADQIKNLDDFSRLPMLTADDVRRKPEDMLCVSQDEITRIVTLQSSGTTGEPKRIFYTSEDLEATVDYFHWGMSHLVGPGETAFVLMPGERPGGVGQLLMQALERAGARAVAHGVMEDSEAALDHLLQENGTCIVGPASHVNMLACAWQRRGLPKGRIKSVLLCWDATPDAVVRRVTDALGCRTYRHWGMIETGLGGAVECAPGAGMHLRETDVYLEIIDPKTGTPMPDGEFGEMVVSTPLKRGMPLIRYRTGDLGRILRGHCPCGTPLRRLDATICRIGGGTPLHTGTLELGELNEALFALPEVEDFVASYGDGLLRLEICSPETDSAKNVMKTLATIPVVRLNTNATQLNMEIVIRNTSEPAIHGLAKRQIMRVKGN